MCYSMCAKTNYEKIKILWKKCLKQLSQRADRCRNGFGWLGACLLWSCCCGLPRTVRSRLSFSTEAWRALHVVVDYIYIISFDTADNLPAKKNT